MVIQLLFCKGILKNFWNDPYKKSCYVQVTIGGRESGRSYLWINVLIVFIIISAFRTKNLWLCPKVNVLWLQWLCQSLPLFVLVTFLGLMWTPLDFPPCFVYSISCIFIGALATRTCCYNLLIICNVILCWLFYQFPVSTWKLLMSVCPFDCFQYGISRFRRFVCIKAVDL